MSCLVGLYLSVVGSRKGILLLATKRVNFTFMGSFQSITDCLAKGRRLNNARCERRRDIKELFFDDVFGMMKECQKFCWILDICSYKGCIRVCFKDLLLWLMEGSFRISNSKVIILEGSGKYGIFLLLWSWYMNWQFCSEFHNFSFGGDWLEVVVGDAEEILMLVDIFGKEFWADEFL